MCAAVAAMSPCKRRDMDIMKLMMSDHEVEMLEDAGKPDLTVVLRGPSETPYEGGVWKIRIELPIDYPYRSPSIGFCNRLYHPNVDEASGSVCLDVINQTWSPMFDLVNIVDVFIPQLMRYPNPTDPLNGEAAALMLRDPEAYARKVKDYVARFASAGSAVAHDVLVTPPVGEVSAKQSGNEGDGELSELSDLSSMSGDEDDVAGHLDM